MHAAFNASVDNFLANSTSLAGRIMELKADGNAGLKKMYNANVRLFDALAKLASLSGDEGLRGFGAVVLQYKAKFIATFNPASHNLTDDYMRNVTHFNTG